MFSKVKSWDNRTRRNGAVVMLPSGKSWTRLIQWLEDGAGVVKLKMEDGAIYKEVMVNQTCASTVWHRFKDGQSIDDSLSALWTKVPESLQSKKAANNKEQP